MRWHLAWSALALLASSSAHGEEANWIFRPSYFSHAPGTCERVTQYRKEDPALVYSDPTYQESGYRQNHSGLRVRNSADNIHIVQTWGQGEAIRPYGEWEYPFRAGATPYGPWGNPQGPWTLPFDSWQNPYGLGQLPLSPWMSGQFGAMGSPGPMSGGPTRPYGPFGQPMAPSPPSPASVQ